MKNVIVLIASVFESLGSTASIYSIDFSIGFSMLNKTIQAIKLIIIVN